MPSTALQEWLTARSARLDEIEAAHRSVGGSGPGRRHATQQINQGYAVLLSAEFQGFCRDFHSECVDHLVSAIRLPGLRRTVRDEFLLHRKLASGNPNPGNIGADFNRLGLDFWLHVEAADVRNAHRKILLGELCEWRNAIAHQDFDRARFASSSSVHLRQVRAWRNACNGLALSFDNVLAIYLRSINGILPW